MRHKTNPNNSYKKNFILTKKIFTAAIITGFVLTSFFYLLSTFATPSSAADAKVNLSFTPSSASFATGKLQSAALLLQTGSSSQKISGYSLVIQSSGVLKLTDVSAPVAIGGGALQAQQIIKKISDKEIQITYVLMGSSSSLPQALSMNVSFYGASASSGKITINSSKSQVVGTISSNVYLWGKLGSGSYSFQ